MLDNMKEWVVITLPKTNSSHLKMDLLGWPIFRCYVSFREGRSLDFVMNSKLHHSYLDEKGG